MHAEFHVLPRFVIQAIVTGDDNTLVDGTFSRPGAAAVGDRGWLFVSETESTIADVASLSEDVARLDVPNRWMTPHVHDLPAFFGPTVTGERHPVEGSSFGPDVL